MERPESGVRNFGKSVSEILERPELESDILPLTSQPCILVAKKYKMKLESTIVNILHYSNTNFIKKMNAPLNNSHI